MKSEGELRHIEVVGARGDPLKMQQLRHRLDVTAYKCAIILCDQSWLDPDLDLSNGIAISSQVGMLRLDSLVLAVQLNIRKLLEVSRWAAFNLQSDVEQNYDVVTTSRLCFCPSFFWKLPSPLQKHRGVKCPLERELITPLTIESE